MIKNTYLMYGVVNGAFDLKTGIGLVSVYGCSDPKRKLPTNDVTVKLGQGPRYVGAGEFEAYFIEGELVNRPMLNMEKVILEVAGNSESPAVVAFGFEESWLRANQAICNRTPIYRVVAENLRNGQKMPGNVRNVVTIEGTLEELTRYSARAGEFVSKRDKLAPIYQVELGALKMTALNKFMRRTKKGMTAAEDVFANCQDPRPFPAGAIYRLSRVVDGKVVEKLGIGTALELNWRYPRGSSQDRLQTIKSDELVWEKREVPVKVLQETEEKWVETRDPRPILELPASMKGSKKEASAAPAPVKAPADQVSVTAPTTTSATATAGDTKVVEAPAAPAPVKAKRIVAKAKNAKPAPFRTVIATSLADLSIAQ